MKTYDMNETMPIDLVTLLNGIDRTDETHKLEELYGVYEQKVSRLKTLTKNYSVKHGYYYQSRLSCVLKNFKIDDIQITSDNIKLFNEYNENFSDKDALYNFDRDLQNNLKRLHRMMIGVSNRGKFRVDNKKIVMGNDQDYRIIPVNHDSISSYIEQIELVNNHEWSKYDRFINSWVIHCYLMGTTPFRQGSGVAARFMLNKNINIYHAESIFLDKYILKELDGYYQALFDFCCDFKYEESINWFLDILEKAILKECSIIDKALLDFYDFLEEFEAMELSINRNAEMLAALFCVGGTYLLNDLIKYLAQDIVDNRTIKKLINNLEEKGYLESDNKLYRIKELETK